MPAELRDAEPRQIAGRNLELGIQKRAVDIQGEQLDFSGLWGIEFLIGDGVSCTLYCYTAKPAVWHREEAS